MRHGKSLLRFGCSLFLLVMSVAMVHARGDGLTPLSPPDDPIIVTNGNTGGVQSGPTHTTVFSIKVPYRVTFMFNYHYFSRGKSPGTIALQAEDGTMYGPWQAEGAAGQGNVPNAYWVVRPNVVLQPGRYKVIDSDPSTWSYNPQSKGAGFIEVRGVKLSAQTAQQKPQTRPEESGGSTAVLSIGGEWLINNRPCRITQSGESLTFINENGQRSRGRFLKTNTIVAEEWGNLQGRLGAYVNGKRFAASEARDRFGTEVSEILWDNKTVWSRAGQVNVGNQQKPQSKPEVPVPAAVGTPAAGQGKPAVARKRDPACTSDAITLYEVALPAPPPQPVQQNTGGSRK